MKSKIPVKYVIILLTITSIISILIAIPSISPAIFNVIRFKHFPDGLTAKDKVVAITFLQFDRCEKENCDIFDKKLIDNISGDSLNYLIHRGRIYFSKECSTYDFMGRRHFLCYPNYSYKTIYKFKEEWTLLEPEKKCFTDEENLTKKSILNDGCRRYKDILYLEIDGNKSILDERFFEPKHDKG
jgi:hypothetical protein